MNYYKYYSGDFMRDTAALSLMEVGAYQRLLNYYYSSGSLPASFPELFRICAAFTEDEQNAVKKVVSAFFKKRADFIQNSRVEIELKKAKEFISLQRQKAYKRHGKAPIIDIPRHSHGTAEAHAETMPYHTPDTIYNINTGKPASPDVEKEEEIKTEQTPNFNDIKTQIANGMSFTKSKGITKDWQEAAFRFATTLHVNLDESQKGRWLKLFKDAYTLRTHMKKNLQIAYSYLSDNKSFISLDAEGKMKFFFKIVYCGPPTDYKFAN